MWFSQPAFLLGGIGEYLHTNTGSATQGRSLVRSRLRSSFGQRQAYGTRQGLSTSISGTWEVCPGDVRW